MNESGVLNLKLHAKHTPCGGVRGLIPWSEENLWLLEFGLDVLLDRFWHMLRQLVRLGPRFGKQASSLQQKGHSVGNIRANT